MYNHEPPCPPAPATSLPPNAGGGVRRRRAVRGWRPLLLSAAAGLLLGGCVSEPSAITGEKKSFGYSWEQELQLGAEADKEISQEMGLYESPHIQAYVESIGQRVLQASDLRDADAAEMYRDTKFVFRVMDSPVVNAFALPGGYVYVTRGLLAHAQNEAQLAVVLGHEIAHVAARHSSQQARRSQLGQIGLIAGALLGHQLMGDEGGQMASNLMDMGGQALQLFMLSYSREAEHESDTLGVGYASGAGYAGGESARFFESLQRISEQEGKALPTWQSSHPDPGDRAQRVQQLAASHLSPGTAPIIGEEEYLRRIEGIVVGEDPREGFVQNGVFFHPTLRFQFATAPGWKLLNEKAVVMLLDPNKKAAMGLRLSPAARARDAAAQFAQESKIQVTNSGDTVVNGLPTTVLIGQAQTEQGPVGVWNAFIELEGRVYSFLGYTPAPLFDQMRATFEQVTGSFQPLRDGRMANVRPARLRLVRAERTATFAAFLPNSLPANLSAEEIAIMNQVQLNERIAPNRILKIPDPSMDAKTHAANHPAPVAYPPQQAYPPAGQPYPPQQPAGYPPPQQPYPPQTSYPPAQPYPPQQPAYPQGQPYPPQRPAYPQGQPYPPNQPPAYPGYPPPSGSQAPVWPR